MLAGAAWVRKVQTHFFPLQKFTSSPLRITQTLEMPVIAINSLAEFQQIVRSTDPKRPVVSVQSPLAD
jgi:hypothetical protein